MAGRAAQNLVLALGRAVLAFHVATEKREQKHIEGVSTECLKALKADGEGAYMIDYYAVAHRIKEKVAPQPGHQFKGLQSMVSLHDNYPNVIVAGEMVCSHCVAVVPS